MLRNSDISQKTRVSVGQIPYESRRNALLCALLVGACVLLAFPVATTAASDDFSYSKTALEFARTGHFRYNGWATAMLGWQIAWGAFFIKLFGFSFTCLRLSTAPVAMATVYLLHQILVRFRIRSHNAVIGALTLGLSPLFFFPAATYLTDVPGTFVLVLCLYMCQRAILAPGERAALLWLVSAGLVNVVGGTVRQTSWMGVLVLVPATAWLLRKRPGMIAAGAATWFVGVVGILLCMHWASHQAYFVNEPVLIQARLYLGKRHLLSQWIRTFFCLFFVVSPVLIGWLAGAPRVTRTARLRVVLLLSLVVLLFVLDHSVSKSQFIFPFIGPILATEGISSPDVLLGGFVALPYSACFIITVLMLTLGLFIAEQLLARMRAPVTQRAFDSSNQWHAALWLTVPLTIGYLLALVQRSATDQIQDRYLLPVMSCAIILLLLVYERWFSANLPAWSTALLVVLAIYTVAATHDFYADLRAAEVAVQELRANGVPRTAIVEGFGQDGWVQVDIMGYFNSGNMVLADKVFNPHVGLWPLTPGCPTWLPQSAEPVLHPKYFITWTVTPCLAPTPYGPISYRAWLPPFHRTRLIRTLLPLPSQPSSR